MSVGERIGGYDVLQQLSAGGMGVVYVAQKAVAQRGGIAFAKKVALKVVHSHLSGDGYVRAAFLDEARLLARMSHPNLVQVFDFGVDGNTAFMAMELLRGVSLARLRERDDPPLSPWLAARLIAEAARGLSHAHLLHDDDGKALDVVHRDISPDNIIVTVDGAVKVLDFGIAWSNERLAATRHDGLVGKPAYMSPEQLRGEKLDARSDIWSLGIVFVELLLGRRLFSGTDWSVASKLANGDVPDWRAMLAAQPVPLREVAVAMLAPRCADRIADARTVVVALDDAMRSSDGAWSTDEVAHVARTRLEITAPSSGLLTAKQRPAQVAAARGDVTLQDAALEPGTQRALRTMTATSGPAANTPITPALEPEAMRTMTDLDVAPRAAGLATDRVSSSPAPPASRSADWLEPTEQTLSSATTLLHPRPRDVEALSLRAVPASPRRGWRVAASIAIGVVVTAAAFIVRTRAPAPVAPPVAAPSPVSSAAPPSTTPPPVVVVTPPPPAPSPSPPPSPPTPAPTPVPTHPPAQARAPTSAKPLSSPSLAHAAASGGALWIPPVEPAVAVVVDGKRVGFSPIRKDRPLQVTAGAHTVELIGPGDVVVRRLVVRVAPDALVNLRDAQ